MSFPFLNTSSLVSVLNDEAEYMAYRITPNSSAKSLVIKIRGGNGKSKKGLSYNSSGAVSSYTREGASPVSFSLVSLASSSASWVSGGFIELSQSLAGGLYRVDLPNAALLSGAQYVLVSISFDGTLEEEVLVHLDLPFSAASGTGAKSHTVQVNSTAGNVHVVSAAVWVSTDLAGDNVIASGRTNNFGSATFLLDVGTYYLWVLDEAYLANNPTTITVV
jgi:hypothetical protein